MRVLVTGSRDWIDYKLVRVTLSGLLACYDSLTVIEGCAKGADSLAERFCTEEGLSPRHHPARWRFHDGEFCTSRCVGSETCYGAGPRRNQEMLDQESPAVVVAFKDGLDPKLSKGGTEDMVRRAKMAEVPVMHVSHGPTPLAQMRMDIHA